MIPQRRLAAGLFIAWAVHDLEEVLTMPATSKLLASRLGHASWPPLRALSRHVRTDTAESALAITLMGTLVLAATVRGATTGGRSRFFQYVLAGLHGHVYTHVALSLRLRRYTTGVVTAVAVVAPYTLWARQVLRTTGALIEGPRPYVLGGALLLPVTFAYHGLARHLLQRGRRP